MTSEEGRVAVKIPAELFKQIQEAIAGTGFATVDDYITYTLYVSLGKKPTKTDTSPDDEQRVFDQLRSLGYL
ncbi:MAG: hypothetical protein QXV32_03740 [Conexivisphaerales archaeon]